MRRWAETLPPLLQRDPRLRAAAESQKRRGGWRMLFGGRVPVAFPGTTLDLTMRPPIGEPGVAAFEAKHGVRVPEPYRTYVAEIADGGAGPGYGIFPLGVRDEAVIGDDIGAHDLRLLAEPFDAERTLGLTFPDIDEDDEDARETAFGEYCDPRWTAGAMFLNHYGCALRGMIVMNGSWAGRILVDLRAELAGIVPFTAEAAKRYHRDDGVAESGEPLMFDEWFESWLRGYRAKF